MNRNLKEEIIDFITDNGWIYDESQFSYECEHYYKEGNIGIDVLDDEVVLIGESGDFLHLTIDGMTIYTLLGFMLHYRYLAFDYKLNIN